MSKFDFKKMKENLNRRKDSSDSAAKEKKSLLKSKGNSSDAAVSNKKFHWTKKKILKAILAVFIAMILAVCAYAGVVIIQAPKINPDDIYSILSENTIIYDDEKEEIDTVYTDANRDNVSIKDVPDNLKYAFIALEDKTFERHHGFNIIRIFGAIKDAVFSGGHVSGTSTITQQLARNLFIPDDRFDRTIKRKIVEAYYAVTLERHLSKDEILEAYLNTIYFGYNSHGVQTAAQAYFSKDVKDLTLAQCAALAAMPQAPSDYQLVEYIEGGNAAQYEDVLIKETAEGIFVANDASKSRRETCLKFMLDQGYISEKEYKEAVDTKLIDMLNPNYNALNDKSSYFADYVIETVINDLAEKKGWDYDKAWKAVYEGGLRIYSTMDSKAQTVAEDELSNSANYPALVYSTDSEGNLINSMGQSVLASYSNYFDENGTFTFRPDEITVKKDKSLVIKVGKRLNIYETEVNGTTDYSLEFKSMYTVDSGELYGIEGGFINIPAEYKSRNKSGDLVIKKEFVQDYPDFFIFNEDGTVSLPAASYTMKSKIIQPQAAMTIIENSTGHIKAMVGGRNTSGRKLFNRATSPRQPGSSIKPLGVYGPAIQQSYEEVTAGKKHAFKDFGIDQQGADLYGDYLTAGSIVIDEPTTINGQVWPKNFNNAFSGAQTMRTAITHSYNTCAVKVLLQVGEEYSADMIEKFGITTLVRENGADVNPAALALGGMTNGVTSLEMASAYTVFPNGGTRKDPVCYTKVTDRDGNVILESKSKEHSVMNSGAAWIMTSMLQSVANTTRAQIGVVQVGGKTGTTDNEVDLWFDGFTPTYSAALWLGTDYNLTLNATSLHTAAIWGRIMSQIPKACRGSFPGIPGNVISSGGEYFIAGTDGGRTDINSLKEKVTICTDSGMLATPECKHVEEKEFQKYGGDDKKPPKYYCHLHNKDVSKYPITPGQTVPPQDDDDDDDKDDNKDSDKGDTKPNTRSSRDVVLNKDN